MYLQSFVVIFYLKQLLDGCIGRVAVGEVVGKFKLADPGVERFCLQVGGEKGGGDSGSKCDFSEHGISLACDFPDGTPSLEGFI